MYNYIKKYENIINKQEDELKPDELIEDPKDSCEYDTSKLKKSFISGFKNSLELLNNNFLDYQVLKKSL